MSRLLLIGVVGSLTFLSAFNMADAQIFRPRTNNCCQQNYQQPMARQLYVAAPQGNQMLVYPQTFAMNIQMQYRPAMVRPNCQTQYYLPTQPAPSNFVLVPYGQSPNVQSPNGQMQYGQMQYEQAPTPALANEPAFEVAPGATENSPSDIQPATFDSPIQESGPVIVPSQDVIEPLSVPPAIEPAPAADSGERSILDIGN